jgi:hypothetical protein
MQGEIYVHEARHGKVMVTPILRSTEVEVMASTSA